MLIITFFSLPLIIHKNLYRTYYDVIKKHFPNVKLLFTDTDSLYYSRECEDFEADLLKIKDILDFSG